MSERRGQFKKTGTADTARKGRHETSVVIRKEKRGDQFANRRRIDDEGVAVQGGEQSMRPLTVNEQRIVTTGLSERMRLLLLHLPQLVEGVFSNDLSTAIESTTQIRKMLSIERNPPIEEVIATGIVPRLVAFIHQEESAELQFESAWALTNIASGTTLQTRLVIDAGAIPGFTRLLASPHHDVREQAIWALGNIAGDNVTYRNLVLETGAMQLLLPLFAGANIGSSIIRNGTWTLSNFCRGKPAPSLDLLHPALAVITNLLQSQDEEVLVDACWALSYISDSAAGMISTIITSGTCLRVVELLMSRSEQVLSPALRVVGNIATGSDVQTQVIINVGVLSRIYGLLDMRNVNVVKEACWTISNITAGKPDQIQAVINANLFPRLICLLESQDFGVKKEACWAVCNATHGGTVEQIGFLITNGVIKPIVDLLLGPDSDLVMVALDTLENLLRAGHRGRGENPVACLVEEAGGIDQIEELTIHDDDEVSHKASVLIDMYFGEEEEKSEWFPMEQSGFQFNMC